MAVLAPVLLLLLFGSIQAGLYFHAREVARHAAEQGVERGSSSTAGPQAGVAAARGFLDRTGGSVDAPQVSDAGSTEEEVHISVRGSVVTLVPGLTLGVSAHAHAPKERWVE